MQNEGFSDVFGMRLKLDVIQVDVRFNWLFFWEIRYLKSAEKQTCNFPEEPVFDFPAFTKTVEST